MMVSIKNVSKKFKRKKVFITTNLELPQSGLFALVGKSGSGKTTLFKMIKGLDCDYQGKIDLDDSDVLYISQSSSIINKISVMDFLNLFSNDITEITRCLTEFKLEQTISLKTEQLSGGERKRLLLIVAILCKKDIVLVDEPFSGSDDEASELLYSALLKISSNSLVIIATHQKLESERYDGIISIEHKKLVLNKTKEREIIKDREKSKYFPQIKRIIRYLKRQSHIAICYILAIFSAASLTSSLIFSTFVTRDEEHILTSLVTSKRGAITLDSLGEENNLVSHNEIESMDFNVNALFLSELFNDSAFQYNAEYIAFENKNEEVSISEDIASFYALNIGSQIDIFGNNLIIDNIIENMASFICLPIKYLQAEYLKDLKMNIYNGDNILGEYKILKGDIQSNAIMFPDTLISVYDAVEFKNIYNDRKLFQYSDITGLNYKRLIGDHSEDIIYVGENIYSQFLTDFYSLELLINDWTIAREVISYCNQERINIRTTVDDEYESMISFQKAINVPMIVAGVSFILLSLVFLITMNMIFDKKIFIKEIRFMEMIDSNRQIKNFHIKAHLMYFSLIILLSAIFMSLILVLKRNTFFNLALIMLISKKYLLICASILVVILLIQTFILMVSRTRHSYKYYNFLMKEKE